MAQRQVRINLLLALLALASKSKIEHSTPLSGQVVSTTCSQEFGCTIGSTAEEIHQGAATAHVDAAADWKINRSADSTLSSEDGIAVVLESGRDCTDRYEDTSEPPLRNFSQALGPSQPSVWIFTALSFKALASSFAGHAQAG